jgi:hypothetical protein
MEEDIFRGNGIEVTIASPDDFLKIKETLQRIGVASKKSNTLWQSCHILHKQGKYAIMHFKELFIMDGKESDITDNDLDRRNTITKLLQDWGLLKVVDSGSLEYLAPLSQIKIIAHKDKKDWQLESKYSIGKKSKK